MKKINKKFLIVFCISFLLIISLLFKNIIIFSTKMLRFFINAKYLEIEIYRNSEFIGRTYWKYPNVWTRILYDKDGELISKIVKTDKYKLSYCPLMSKTVYKQRLNDCGLTGNFLKYSGVLLGNYDILNIKYYKKENKHAIFVFSNKNNEVEKLSIELDENNVPIKCVYVYGNREELTCKTVEYISKYGDNNIDNKVFSIDLLDVENTDTAADNTTPKQISTTTATANIQLK